MLGSGVGLTHVPRARNFIFENKFSREDFLAKCHWHVSPTVRAHGFATKKKAPDKLGLFSW